MSARFPLPSEYHKAALLPSVEESLCAGFSTWGCGDLIARFDSA
jgi:hypothetical protein